MNKQKTLVITCMKDEGAFVLEWVAYHLAIGIDHFLVYTNDCSDGTDRIIRRLETLGYATHRDNFKRAGQRASYQIRAFRRARQEPLLDEYEWTAIIDVDEFINIHVGNGTLADLISASGGADIISLAWRLFGNAGNRSYSGNFLIDDFTRAAADFRPRPAQAWGMKSLFRTEKVEAMGTHRPRRVRGSGWNAVRWVNGNGEEMPERYHDSFWRFHQDTIGYKLAQVNHYAVRYQDTFLLKFQKGMVHGGMERDAEYWRRMNLNDQTDTSILRMRPKMKEIYDRLLEDPELKSLHEGACDWLKTRISDARKDPELEALYHRLSKGRARG